MLKENIIEKVRKLLALSASNNVNEAAAAAALANKLIDANRLSEADLEDVVTENIEPIEEDSEHIYVTSKVTGWKSTLITNLAKHYGCAIYNDAVIISNRKQSRYRMVGRRSDLGITRYMFNWLLVEIQRLADITVKGCGRVTIASYCMGFVHGIIDQLKISRSEASKDASSSALIKINAREDEAKKMMLQWHNLAAAKKYSSSQVDQAAFGMGKDKGKSFHLGASVAGGTTRLLGS